MPLCFGPPASVRQRAKIQSANFRLAGPDLLAVDHPLVSVESGPRRHTRQVAPGVGLAEALTPELLAPEDRRQTPRPLRF